VILVRDLVRLFQTLAAILLATKTLTVLQPNMVPSVTLLLALANLTAANMMEIVPILTLASGITVKHNQMVLNVASKLLNARMILVVMTKILALKIFAYQSTVSAEMLQDVMTITNVPTTFALLPPTENLTLVLILLVHAPKILPFSMLTLFFFPMKRKSSGWENVIKRLDALLAY
jgi:hypothetical protein